VCVYSPQPAAAASPAIGYLRTRSFYTRISRDRATRQMRSTTSARAVPFSLSFSVRIVVHVFISISFGSCALRRFSAIHERRCSPILYCNSFSFGPRRPSSSCRCDPKSQDRNALEYYTHQFIVAVIR